MNKDQPISQQQLEEIERFLQQDMSQEESTAFAARMKEDPALQKLTDEMRLLFVGIREATLSKNLASFHDDLETEKKSTGKSGTIFKLNTRWLVAASLFIIVSVAAWLLVTGKNHYEKLYSSYYQPDPGLMTAMSATDNYLFEKGMVNYKNGEYKQAIDNWDPLLAKNPADDTLQYFMGVANQALGHEAPAKKHLEIIVKDSTNAFYKDACWYLGILLLKQGDTGPAKIYIERSNHPEKAALLNAINQD